MSTNIAAPQEAADRDAFRYRLEFADDEQTLVRAEPLAAADFNRSIRETFFAGFRQTAFPTYQPQLDEARIEPCFAQADPTRVEAFRVVVPRPDAGEFAQEFSANYFLTRTATIRAEIERSQNWPPSKLLHFTLRAYLDEQPSGGASSGSPPFTFGPESVCVPVQPRRRRPRGSCEAWDDARPDDLPAEIARTVLEDGCEEAARHPDREIGGLLLGRVCSDPDTREAFVQVTSFVSGEGTTESTAASVTFTADSFAKAREMIRLRARSGAPEETVVGWLHSHPFRFCDACPLPTPVECIQKILFYSVDDLQLMESTFYQPFMVGLLAAVETKLADALGHLPVRLFGWRQGEIQQRGFEVFDC